MVENVDVRQLAVAAQRGCRILDVREPHEYHAGHVPGAESIPVARVPALVDRLPRREPVYVVCESGSRSGAAARYLSLHGLDARTVTGGTAAWRGAGLPVRVGGLA